MAESYNFNIANPYQQQQEELARRQKMAEILQQQSFQPMERNSYAGIEAPISPYAGLAKMLQAYTGAKGQQKVAEERMALGERYRADQMADMTALGTAINAPAVPGSAAVPERTEIPMPAEDLGGGPSREAAPAIPAVPARQAGYISPEMIAGMKTPQGSNQALALSLAQRQAQIEAERRANEPFNLTGDQIRYQPTAGGGPLREIARGIPKTEFAPVDVSKFTPESLQAAMKPDGTVDRTLLRAIPERRTGPLGVYDEYVKQTTASGKTPKSIEQFETDQKIAGRTPAAQRERFVYDAARGGRVNLDTGELMPVTQGGAPIGGKERPLPTGEVEKITSIDNAFGTQKRLADTFEDKYGGYSLKIGGELANVFGGKFGGDNQAQSEWWASHDANDNVARNALFGASLTAGEQKAWEKTSINPGMSASMIKNRMTERQDLIDAKRKTTINNLDNAGYDVKGFKNTKDFYESFKKPIMKARNPTTGAEIISTDGGNTWQPAGR
jgi:hypothetical protein